MRKSVIVLIGILLLGAFYYWLERELGPDVFFVIGIAYLVLLRLFAEKYGRGGRHELMLPKGQSYR